MLLELMMEAAERTEVTGTGQAALVVRLGVVRVAAPGWLAAGREPASQVTQVDEFAEPGRNLVGGAGLGMSASPGGSIGGGSVGGLADCPPGSDDDRCGHWREVVIGGQAAIGGAVEFLCGHDDSDTAHEARAAETDPGWTDRGWTDAGWGDPRAGVIRAGVIRAGLTAVGPAGARGDLIRVTAMAQPLSLAPAQPPSCSATVIGDDDPPFHGRVGRCEEGEVIGLDGGDRPESGQVAGFGTSAD